MLRRAAGRPMIRRPKPISFPSKRNGLQNHTLAHILIGDPPSTCPGYALTNGTAPMPAETHLFRCLKDNFGVLVHDPATGATAAIDAPEAAPVEAVLKATGWRLTAILVTHPHADHTGGVAELKARHGCRVTAPRNEAARIPAVDASVGEGDTVKVGSLTARGLEAPGHTAGHITYVFDQDKLAFVGDTLFSIGCGRVIEGTPEMMWASLLKLRALPDDAQIFCGHEYTEANIRFALTIEPDNEDLRARAEEAKRQVAAGEDTIPTRIGAEKREKVLLRADVHAGAGGGGPARK